MHPRTANAIKTHGLAAKAGRVRMVEPVSFFDMVRLEQSCKVVVTDSGGVQKEAYFHGVPCVTVRDNTEWTELLTHGWNQLAGANAEEIAAAVGKARTGSRIAEYGDGSAGARIVEALLGHAAKRG